MTPILGTIASSTRQGLSTGAFEHIATYTITTGTAIINATSIPSTYSHLRVICTARSEYSSTGVGGSYWKFLLGSGGTINTSANYSYGLYYGRANASVSYSWSGLVNQFQGEAPWSNVNSYGGTLFNTSIYDIIDYAGTSNIKTVRYYNGFNANSNSGNCYVAYYYGTLNASGAIDTLRFDSSLPYADGIFAANTTFDIYGIK